MGYGRHGMYQMNIHENALVLEVPIPYGVMVNATRVRADDEETARKRASARVGICKRFSDYYYKACGSRPGEFDFLDLDHAHMRVATENEIKIAEEVEEYGPDWPFEPDPRDG